MMYAPAPAPGRGTAGARRPVPVRRAQGGRGVLTAELDGERILITDPAWAGRAAELRAAAAAGRLRAPCCGERLAVKWGARKTPHFAHWPRSLCPYQRWAEPESAEHAGGKLRLWHFCRAYFAGRLSRCELEYPLPETGQRPDVFVELADGTRLALEYQRAEMPQADWEERHQRYAAAGIADVWVLGENRLAAAVPPPETAARWTGGEPDQVALRPRAFEAAAARPTPWDAAAWRPYQQPLLWLELEQALRVGAPGAEPWYEKPAVRAAGSLFYLEAATGRLTILRALHPARGYRDVRVGTLAAEVELAPGAVELGPDGFWTAADAERQRRFAEQREAAERARPAYARGREQAERRRAAEAAAAYGAQWADLQAVLARELPPGAPPAWRERAESRRRWLERAAARGRLAPADLARFHLPAQEAEQRRWGEARPANPAWQRLKRRFRLTPDTLAFPCGVPIPDDTVIQVHRSVWQAYIYYQVIQGRRWRSHFQVQWIVRELEQHFPVDHAMSEIATRYGGGELLDLTGVVGQFLNILADLGYLRSEGGNPMLPYYRGAPLPTYALARRERRWEVWLGLLERRLRLEPGALLGPDGERIPLVEVEPGGVL